MSRATILGLLLAPLLTVGAIATERRDCTAISSDAEKAEWSRLDRTVSYRLRAHRLYLSTVRNAEFVRGGDFSLCNKCAYEIISLLEIIASAPPSYLEIKYPGWHEELSRILGHTRALQRDFVWPACDGKPVDWDRFDEVR